MEKQEKKTEVKNVEKVEKETTSITSSYVKINDLTASDIKELSKVKGLFLPRITKSSKSYTYEFTLHENGIIINLEVIGGCNGNLKGISSLVKGLPFEEVINRLNGITCGFKNTSCPDQLAQGLKQLL